VMILADVTCPNDANACRRSSSVTSRAKLPT